MLAALLALALAGASTTAPASADPVALAVQGVSGEPVKTTLAGQITVVKDEALKMV